MAQSNWQYWYQGYLWSDEWKAKRERVLILANYTCQDCGQPYENVHHLNYSRVGYERLEDLVVLCRRCHEDRHGLPHSVAKTFTKRVAKKKPVKRKRKVKRFQLLWNWLKYHLI